MMLKTQSSFERETKVRNGVKSYVSPFGGFIQMLETEKSYHYFSMLKVMDFPKSSLELLSKAVLIDLPISKVTNNYLAENGLRGKFVVSRNSVVYYSRGRRMTVGRSVLARLQEVVFSQNPQIDLTGLIRKAELKERKKSFTFGCCEVKDMGDFTVINNYVIDNKMISLLQQVPVLIRNVMSIETLDQSFKSSCGGLTFTIEGKVFLITLDGVYEVSNGIFKESGLAKAINGFIGYKEITFGKESPEDQLY